MSHGLQLFDATGVLQFTSDDIAARIIDTFEVTSSASGSVTKPEYQGCHVFVTPTNQSASFSVHYVPHNVTISGTTVSYTPAINSTVVDPVQNFTIIPSGSKIIVVKVG